MRFCYHNSLMNLSNIHQTEEFQFGLLKYRALSSLLTFVVGVLFLTGGDGTGNAIFSLQTTVWMAVLTGLLGAGITSYQFCQYIRSAIGSCVIDTKELHQNNYIIWRKHCSDWSFMPIFGIVLSLVMLVFAGGEHGMMWLFLYMVASPVLAAFFRLVALSVLGTPAHRTVI